MHGHCPDPGSTGVGRRPTPEPPAGARIYWRVAPINSSEVNRKNCRITKFGFISLNDLLGRWPNLNMHRLANRVTEMIDRGALINDKY